MKKLSFFLLMAALIACQKPNYPVFPTDNQIVGLSQPLQLNPGGNPVILTDWFPNPGLIDSVYFNGKKLSLSDDRVSSFIRAPRDGKPIMEMLVYTRPYTWSIPVKDTRKIATTITFDPQGQSYQVVQLKGEFNGWTASRTQMELKNGKYQVVLYLNPGTYQYLIVADGVEMTDPGNPEKVDNNMGKFNSVLKVGGEEADKIPFLFTKCFDKSSIEIGTTGQVEKYLVYWQNFRLDSVFLDIDDDELEIAIPEQAKKAGRTFVRVYGYNASGLANDLLVPLDNGLVVTDPKLLDRTDFHAATIYNVFIDRFYDGNPANDEPLNSPDVLPAADFKGGDLAGVIDKVKSGYFTDLGVNTIWISPIIRNPKGAFGLWKDPLTKFSAYHGYWPISFTQIDSRFGTPEDFQELIKEAHARNINVLLDFVAHHVHKEHPYHQKYPERTTNLYLPDGSLNTEKWDEYRLTTWFDVFLPTLDLQNPEVTTMLVDSAIWWLQTYPFDGFRHDATKHIPEIFWRQLTQRVKQQVEEPQHRTIYQIGETYGGAELISSYVGSGMLDGQFDFNVYDAAVGVFARAGDPFTRLNQVLQESFMYYGNHNEMGYITGNQDRARFISYAGGDLKFEENAKAAGWTRNVGVGDPIGYKRLSMLTAFNMTIPGIPVIYYGDEIGIPGGNDPDSRRMMRFDGLTDLEQQTKETAKQLLAIRNSSLAFSYGDFYPLQVTEKTYVFLRKYFDEIAIVVFNKGDEETNIDVALPEWADVDDLQANFGSSFKIKGDKLTMTLQPWSFEILTGGR
jgi:glycosidase